MKQILPFLTVKYYVIEFFSVILSTQTIYYDETKISNLFLYLFLSVLCYGQTGKLFTVDNELSSSMINSIYQDKEDIIWIATEDGLNRYDGAKFSVYKHDSHDEHSLQNNYVRILFEDKKGTFFVGTLNGLQTYDRATGVFPTFP